MKLFGIAPPLLVLVALCGAQVAQAPGSISGTVYFDANRNGIRDKCDGPLGGVDVVVTGSEGKSTEARTDEDGLFFAEPVPAGEARVTLPASKGSAWLITTPAADGTPGALVQVATRETTDGVEIGSASRTAFTTGAVTISGVLFNDANANGEIDRDECPLPDGMPADVYVSGGQAFGDIWSRSNGGSYVLRGGSWTGVVRANLASGELTPSDNGGFGSCSGTAKPVGRYGPRTFEANIGFVPSGEPGSAAGVVYDDKNGNLVRDPGDELVEGLTLHLSPQNPCGPAETKSVRTGSAGEWSVSGLSPGLYLIWVEEMRDNEPVFYLLSRREPDIRVEPGVTSEREVAIRVTAASLLNVRVFDEASENQTPLAGVRVCAETLAAGNMKEMGSRACDSTNQSGVARLGPLQPGEYLLRAEVALSDPQQRTVTLTAGTQAFDFGVDLRPIDEQIIQPGTEVATDPLTVCLSDPGFIQPPFDEIYVSMLDSLDPDRSAEDIERTDRETYEQRIYRTGSAELGTWSRFADYEITGGRFASASVRLPVFVLSGYEPLEVLRSNDTIQVRAAFRGAGVYGIDLQAPKEWESGEKYIVFVNESYQPILRCGYYGYCDEPGGRVTGGY